MSDVSLTRRIFSGTLRFLDTTRRVIINLVFLVIVVFLVVLMVGGEKPVRVDDGIALLFNPSGVVVEEFDASPADRAMNRLLGTDIPQVRLRDLRAALKLASEDRRIDTIVLDLSDLAPVSLSKLEELVEPLATARANGKRILAYAEYYGQSQYLLAAHADEIHMHPLGMVSIDGFSTYRTYRREALDRLSVDWHVFKAGDFKSFGEPYERDSMSPQVREETAEWIGAMWSRYQDLVEGARGLESGAVTAYIDGLIAGVTETGGDFASYAEQTGMLDGLMHRDQFENRVAERVGVGAHGYRSINWQSYLGARRTERRALVSQRDGLGLLVAHGSIVEGDPGLHAIGSTRMVNLIGEAAEDDALKALVLRIDSGGGSAFASEEILVALRRFRESGKPLVVSMGSVAASGGYWISMAADEIWATPATITGSIGVVGMFPTIPRAMERLGLRTDGVATTPFAGAFRIDRPLNEEVSAVIRLSIDGIYADFLERVAAAREMEIAEVDALGGGRVYTGMDAQQLGLVDALGGLDDAIKAAAKLAGLENYAVTVLERAPTFQERILISMLDAKLMQPVARMLARSGERPLLRWVEQVERELGFLTSLRDPRHAYLHCLCEAP